jgi:hypothetical protein
MRKIYISAGLILSLVLVSLSPAKAVYNGTSAVEGLAVQVYSSNSSCTGVLWQPTIVITAAHCIFESSGTLKSPLTVRGLVNKEWISSDVAGVRAPLTFTGTTGNSIYSGQSDSDIAFLILKNKIWESQLFPNLRLATSTDWERFKTSYTGLEVHGFGYLNNEGTTADEPKSAFFAVQPNLSAGNKDWAVMQSINSSLCQGDSGGPAIYYREAEKALILVGIVVGISGTTTKCGSYQFGLYTATFTLLSSYSGLASSTELTENKYRIGKDAIDEISSTIDKVDQNLIDLDNFMSELPITLQKKIKANSNLKNINKQLDVLKTQYDGYIAALDESMSFVKINSALIEANSSAIGYNWQGKSAPVIQRIDSYLTKLSKSLPSSQCITATQVREIQSNGKCPKGYLKVSLEKPF